MEKKVEKKEKNMDFNLIISEEEFRENQKRIETKERKQKIIKKKKERKRMIIRTIVFTILILLFGAMVYWNASMKNEAYHNCLDNSYEEAYCLRNS